MIVRKIIDKMYGTFVNSVPGIRERYKKRRYHGTKGTRVIAWLYLIYLNIAYHVLRKKEIGVIEKYPFYEKKLLYTKGSESSLSKRINPKDFARELKDYDVISFDVFDTLIFRPFSSPTDLFFLLGNELQYMDFKKIRIEMEWKARKKKYKNTGNYEVNLDEIYSLLAEETGIEKESAMRREIELEYKVCFANPYMYQVVNELRKMKKRLIITSDMYLNTDQIRKLLEKCGYGNFDSYYVSCDIGRSKSEGTLYDEVKRCEEKHVGKRTLAFVHVGDNYISDVENSRKHGFSSKHYVNVNDVGARYRPEDMSAITGSLYRGIVNTHIHNGLYEYSREYEYGFIYGGLFVTGYCQFIHRYVDTYQIEKILFLARDGYVLKKAYEILYPEEAGKCRYVYWSRLAATKMAAGYFKYDYFRRFLYHKVNQGYSLEKILISMELADMQNDLYKTTGFHKGTELTDKNVEKIKRFLEKRWEKVLDHYEEQLDAGKQYFSEILVRCESAVAVDIGWAGSGAITLNYIVNQIWKMDVEITGIIAGTNTCHNAEPDASETFLQSGQLVSYMYSQRENRDLWKFHDAGKNHNLYWEMLLDAPHGSLKGIYLDENGKWKCEFKKEKIDTRKVKEIHEGIMDFIKLYQKRSENYGRLADIKGRDAYAAMLLAEKEENKEFFKELCDLKDEIDL